MTNSRLKTIHVYGALAKLLKRRTFKADVRSPQEAISFLLSNFPETEAYIRPRFFYIRVGRRQISEEDIDSPVGSYEEICITPAICGAGGNGLFQIIAGAFLIAVSIFVPFTAPLLLPLGLGLTLTGVSTLLTPTPADRSESTNPSERDSYNFNGLQQTSREGVPVPLVYGEIMTGSVTLSVKVEEDDDDPLQTGCGKTLVPDIGNLAIPTAFYVGSTPPPGLCVNIRLQPTTLGQSFYSSQFINDDDIPGCGGVFGIADYFCCVGCTSTFTKYTTTWNEWQLYQVEWPVKWVQVAGNGTTGMSLSSEYCQGAGQWVRNRTLVDGQFVYEPRNFFELEDRNGNRVPGVYNGTFQTMRIGDSYARSSNACETSTSIGCPTEPAFRIVRIDEIICGNNNPLRTLWKHPAYVEFDPSP